MVVLSLRYSKTVHDKGDRGLNEHLIFAPQACSVCIVLDVYFFSLKKEFSLSLSFSLFNTAILVSLPCELCNFSSPEKKFKSLEERFLLH